MARRRPRNCQAAVSWRGRLLYSKFPGLRILSAINILSDSRDCLVDWHASPGGAREDASNSVVHMTTTSTVDTCHMPCHASAALARNLAKMSSASSAAFAAASAGDGCRGRDRVGSAPATASASLCKEASVAVISAHFLRTRV